MSSQFETLASIQAARPHVLSIGQCYSHWAPRSHLSGPPDADAAHYIGPFGGAASDIP